MAVAAVTYTFASLTDAKASEVNRNFADLVNFINQNLIQKDGSVAFTAVPSGPAADPVSDNQFTRKAYVDKGPAINQSNFTPGGTSNLTSASFTDWPNVGGTYSLSHTKRQASTNILVIYTGSGYCVTSPSPVEFAVRVDGVGDNVVTKFAYNTLSEHHTHTGGVTIGGIGVGAHTYLLRARRVSGTGAIRCDGNDRHQFIIMEIP